MSRFYESGPCPMRACVRIYGHRGDHVFKPCAAKGCKNHARNAEERYCTKHEDRSTYEKYQEA